MTRFWKWSAAVLVLVAVIAGTSCEKRPTGYDPTPGMPEGVTNPAAQLLAYRNTALRVMARDYASTHVDSVVTAVSAFAGSASMPLVMLLDGTPANTFELYRRADGGNFERTTDFPLQSTFKFVNAGYEMFFSTDPAPSRYAPSTYLARGLVDGVASHQSPLSNQGQITTNSLTPILYNGDLQPLDSLFVVSWVGVPNAVGYWVHIYEKPISGLERLISSLPSPIAYTTAGDLFIGYRAGNNPGGSVQFRLGDTSLLTLKARAPLLGHDYQVRVSAVDATGHVFAQTPGDLDSLSVSSDMAFLVPPTFSTDKTKAFFSLGGTKVARRRLIPRGPASVVEGPEPGFPSASDGMLERHVPMVRVPYVGPFRSLAPIRLRH